MGFKRTLAIVSARLLSVACRLAGKQGVTMAGKLAMKIDPSILKDLSKQVRKEILVVCGTNGKTTTNNLLCSMLESENKKVICNHTGSNMLMGVAAAFVLNASLTGKIDCDYACIEVDEASALRVFPHMKPSRMVITNLFRDQLDRYGEIDLTIRLLLQAMEMVPEMELLVNGDDALVVSLAQESGHRFKTYGISEKLFDSEGSREVREGQFCRCCGARLVYDFYHYSQIGSYHCPECSFARPAMDFDVSGVDMKNGLAFTVSEGESIGPDRVEKRRIVANYRGFYNIYNILASYGAARMSGFGLEKLDQVLSSYNPQNGRNEVFQIGESRVLLNLAKNPAGFNQNISSVMEDTSEKDLIIVINDNAQDGTDVSWLWDVDFDRFEDPSVRSITVSGLRGRDMRLRLKYVDIPSQLEEDIKTAIQKKLDEGSKNLYVLVNYTALYGTHLILKEMAEKA